MTIVLGAIVWLIGNYPGAAVTIALALLGVGWWGRTLQAAKLIPSWVPLLALPVAAIWLLARRTKGGRRGIAVVGPWAVAVIGALLFWLAPPLRLKLAIPVLVFGLVYAVVAIDQWLGLDPATGRHRPWTLDNFRRGWARDEATMAMRAGIGVAVGGKHAKTTRAKVAEDGRMTISGTVPTGAKVTDVESAAHDGTFGAAANDATRLGLTDVDVVPGEVAGTYTAYATIVGQSHPLAMEHPFPMQEP